MKREKGRYRGRYKNTKEKGGGYVLRKVTICNVPLTQEKWSIATVRPILRETLPKSVRFPSVVATMTKTRQNVRINSMPTPCTRV